MGLQGFPSFGAVAAGLRLHRAPVSCTTHGLVISLVDPVADERCQLEQPEKCGCDKITILREEEHDLPAAEIVIPSKIMGLGFGGSGFRGGGGSGV